MSSARAVRVEAGEPARKTALASARPIASSGTTTVGSPSTSFSAPVSSAPDEMRLRWAGKWLVANRSRISRPVSDSLPTSATVAVLGALLANLVLRLPGTRRPQIPPHDTTDANDDSTGDIRGRHRQQH